MRIARRLWMGPWSRATLVSVVLTTAFLALPLVLGQFAVHVLTITFYYVILASSWNMLAGYTGRFSLAQPTFATLGAYTTGLLAHYLGAPSWVGILAGTGVATISGLVLGILVLRMAPIYLTLATWTFAATVTTLLTAGYDLTRGQLGLAVPTLFGHLDPRAYYPVFLLLASSTVLMMYFVVYSRIGQFMRSIKDNELRASTLGVDTTRWKLTVFGLTSLFSGVAGAFYAHYIAVVSPSMSSFAEAGKIMSMTIVGGLGTFLGPIVGSVLIQILLTYFQQYGEWSTVGYAAVVIVVMRWYRGGLVALSSRAIRAVWRLVPLRFE